LVPFVIAGATGVWLVGGPSIPPVATAALVVVATAGVLALAAREHRSPGRAAPIVIAIGLLLVVAVAAPNRTSNDLRSYTMVGRTVSQHHANPYEHPPADFPHDPLTERVAGVYRDTTTPYGPLFVAVAGGITTVTGTSALGARLGFQAVAAFAVAAALVLVWRSTRSTAALVLLGLHPLVAGSLVNGGHDDALLALLLVAAVLLVLRSRARAGGFAAMGATLVKATTFLAVPPLFAWIWARHGWRAARDFAVPVVAVSVPLTLLVPGEVRSVANLRQDSLSRESPWHAALVVARALGEHWKRSPAIMLGVAALVILLAIDLVAVFLAATSTRPDLGVVVATSAWVFAGAYFLPWYAIAALAVAALHPSERLSRLVALQAGAVTAAYAFQARAVVGTPVLDTGLLVVLPLLFLAVFAVVVYDAAGRRASSSIQMAST
jgi:alpha-1,6-mannosyltransferase